MKLPQHAPRSRQRGFIHLSRNLARWAAKPVPVFDPVAYFAGGGSGSWCDPNDLSTMYQDEKGQTPGAVGQQVGLLLDKSRAMALSRVSTWTFADGTGVTPGANTSVTGGKLVFANASAVTTTTYAPTIGKLYKVTYTISGYTGGSVVAANGAKTGTSRSANGTFVDYLMASAVTTLRLTPTGFTGSIDDLLVDEVLGCHIAQATAASRYILRQTAGGFNYLESDGIDDVMAGPTNGAAYPAITNLKHYFCAVAARGVQDTSTIVQFGPSATAYHRINNSGSSLRITSRAADPGIDSLSGVANSFPLNTPCIHDSLVDGPFIDVATSGAFTSSSAGAAAGNTIGAGLITIGAAALSLQFYGHISIVGGVTPAQRTSIRKYMAAHTGGV